jgi:hypothetical protein
MSKQFSLIPEPPFCPILPPKHTAAEQALFDLLERDHLNHIEWIQEGKGWRLGAAIKQLDYLGWKPESVMVKCPGWKRAIARSDFLIRTKHR